MNSMWHEFVNFKETFPRTNPSSSNAPNYLVQIPQGGHDAQHDGRDNMIYQDGVDHTGHHKGNANRTIQTGRRHLSTVKGKRNGTHQEGSRSKAYITTGDDNRLGQLGSKNYVEYRGDRNESIQIERRKYARFKKEHVREYQKLDMARRYKEQLNNLWEVLWGN
ncbi:hypothetical protein F5Y13DRAFT_87288 [Hypoxylon sp. FL1857]|nr:hypothetical protein F5Y13DRAFT_87288 [Hypoxylon sp. FL1857]